MPYQIDRTDGTVLVTLADGVVDTTTDLLLVGRNVAGYGEQQNENFVKLLENFARADTPPSKPLVGQLWFDKNADKLRPSVFDGTQWRNLSITQVQATEPSNQKEGDLWWDTVNNKLYVWQADGNQHILVGPESIVGYDKTRWSSEILTDTLGTDHPCSIGYIDGEPYMVMSDASFTIDQTATPLTGFTEIGVGITAKSTNSNGITSGSTRFFGTAGDADRLGGRLADTWANRLENEDITGDWSFKTDEGIKVGVDSELHLSIDSQVAQIFNTSGVLMRFGVDYAGSGADKTVIYLDSKQLVPYADNQVNLGTPTIKYRNIYADAIYANMVGDAIGTFAGSLTGNVTGDVTGNVTGTVTGPTIGTVSSTGGKVIVNNDQVIALTTAGRDGESGNYTGYFDGTAKYVVDGMYRTNNQTISGSKTFTATQNFNAAVNVNHTLTVDNINVTEGTLGSSGNTTLLQYATVSNTTINTSTFNGGTIQNATVINGANIGRDAPATQVKAQKFVDAVGTEITRFSTDGQFLSNSDTKIPTEKAVKTYVDTVFGSTGQDIQFYLDTKDMTVNDVKVQLARLAPPNNFKEGTIARILGSYYYADHGVAPDGTPQYFQKYTRVFRSGIGYIGGRWVTTGAGTSTDLINKKSTTVGYEFQLSATGSITTDSQTYPTNSNAGNFVTLLQGGTLTGWVTFNTALNSDQADEFSTDAVLGAKLVILRNGLVESYSSDANLLQTLVGNVTYERNAASTYNATVNLAGYATQITVFSFDRIARTSAADWVYKGNI